LNKKELVRGYIKNNRYFNLDTVAKKIGLSKQVVKNYLHFFKSEGVIFSAGGGIYSSVTEEFSCPVNSRVTQIKRIIKKEFPLLDFIIWNTLYFQGYYHHMQTHNITFVEVEQDGIQPVADRLARSYRFVSVEKKSQAFDASFNITKDPIIVRSLISRSPRDGHNPCLEKLLVDMFIIKDKYKTMPEADYWELWSQIYSLYRINFGELINYARRRKYVKVLMPQVIDKLEINKVIFGTKVGLVSKVTKRKSISR